MPISVPMPGDTVGLADAAVEAGNQEELLAVLGAINTVVGVLANWLQVATVLVALIENALNNSPDMVALLEDIDQKVTELVQLVPAGITETKMLNITDYITAARDRLNTLILEGPSGPAVNEPMFFGQCQDAAYIFADSTYWIRPYAEEVTYLGAYGPQTGQIVDYYLPGAGQPPTTDYLGSSWVYDPQLPLPAFAVAITIFTSLAAIFHQSDPETLYPYCNDLATFMDKNYQMAVQGLVMPPVPSIDLLKKMFLYNLSARLDVQDGQSLPVTFLGEEIGVYEYFWHGEIGAVDIYSPFGGSGWQSAITPLSARGDQYLAGVINPGNVIGIYPSLATLINSQFDEPHGAGNWPESVPYFYPWFYLRVRMGNLARWKALYLAKGYNEIWKLIQKLRFMSAGQPGTPLYGGPPTPSPETVDDNGYWRLTEIFAIYGELPKGNWWVSPPAVYDSPPPPYPQQPVSLSRMSAEQVITIWLSARDNSVNNSTEAEPGACTYPRPLSLRKTIATVAI